MFDHFHIIKLFNEKLTNCVRSATRSRKWVGQTCLKGIRWLLLKNPDNLDDKRNERQRLDEALSSMSPATAYYMKKSYAISGINRINSAQMH
ncbi:MAG: transposase [Nitrosomonas sp.]|nr:transposase [Nitrosomonas sp.]